MTSISIDKEWLEKSIESEYIRFYPYDSLTDKDCIGHGAFGVVFKATVAGSGITVAYKMIKYLEEDEFLKCFVKEVCNCSNRWNCIRINETSYAYSSSRFIAQ